MCVCVCVGECVTALVCERVLVCGVCVCGLALGVIGVSSTGQRSAQLRSF